MEGSNLQDTACFLVPNTQIIAFILITAVQHPPNSQCPVNISLECLRWAGHLGKGGSPDFLCCVEVPPYLLRLFVHRSYSGDIKTGGQMSKDVL